MKQRRNNIAMLYRAGKTQRQIANLLNVSVTTVNRHLKQGGVEGRTPAESYWRQEIKPFTKLQEQLILGSLLGDLCLYEDNYRSRQTKRPCKTYRLAFAHSKNQLDYLQLKLRIMGRNLVIHSRKSGHGADIKYFTYTDGRRLIDIANICLTTGKKHVTKSWLKKLGPAGWAFFLQDDGSCTNGLVRFATYSMSQSECQLIVEALGKLKIESAILWRKRAGKQKLEPYVRLKSDAALKFFKMVRPWVMSSLSHKVNGLSCGWALPRDI